MITDVTGYITDGYNSTGFSFEVEVISDPPTFQETLTNQTVH